jgi:hypothetical protein
LLIAIFVDGLVLFLKFDELNEYQLIGKVLTVTIPRPHLISVPNFSLLLFLLLTNVIRLFV